MSPTGIKQVTVEHDDGLRYTFSDIYNLSMSHGPYSGYEIQFGASSLITEACVPLVKEEKKVACRIPELYPENLDALKDVMDQVETLSSINGVFEIEIRVRLDDLDIWAVIGWGESGDPCVLRFEEYNI